MSKELSDIEIQTRFKFYELDNLRDRIKNLTNNDLKVDSEILKFCLQHINGEDYQKLKKWYSNE